MGKYIAKRLLWIIPVVLGVTVEGYKDILSIAGCDGDGVHNHVSDTR